jgi:hypothetical protein
MRIITVILTAFGTLLATGCGMRTISLESDSTFAMHQENRVFVVDRSPSGTKSVVSAAEWVRLPGDPAWALSGNARTLAAYWIDGNAGTTARAGRLASDEPLGTVSPSWDDQAIRLHIDPPDGVAVKSDVFARTDGGGGPLALGRTTRTILDLRGRYQAALRDASGAEVGWLRLRIGPYESAARICEATLPAGLDDRLGVAAVLSLAQEIDWIEAHALNVYENDKGPLIQSIPIH